MGYNCMILILAAIGLYYLFIYYDDMQKAHKIKTRKIEKRHESKLILLDSQTTTSYTGNRHEGLMS